MPIARLDCLLPLASDFSIPIGTTPKSIPKFSGESAVEQAELLKFAIRVLEGLNIPYAIVGSFASGTWGESRFTQDIDILIEIQPARIDKLCDAFPSAEFYVSHAAAREAVARRGQFNVIHPASGNKIDFMIASSEGWNKWQLDRCKRVQLFADQDGAVAAPEDIIVGKLIYYHDGGSDKHLRDIAGILKISGDSIDHAYLSSAVDQLGLASLWQLVLNGLQHS